ncbi:MAG TPA: Rieske 2Fe-2S domain-containing protein [Planctomycetota bacterium]
MAYVRLAPLEDFWSGELRGEVVDGRKVLVVRRGGDVLAYEDRCAHLGVRLSEGRLEGDVLTCAAHEWTYDVRTGQGVNPAAACLKRFPAKVEDGQVWVDVSDA